MKLSKIRCFWPLIVIFLVVAIFFWKFVLKGLLPIPADTIVGMYHPWRDVVWNSFTAGVPFKNFLITDPVRQQFPWRQLSMNLLKKGQLPFWNPYAYAGTPLLANLQSAVFYPLNLLYFLNFSNSLLDFNLIWAIQIILQPLLAGVFLYFYLHQLKLKKIASLVGGLSFAFSGFFVVWLEWGTVLHAGLWLPLVLLSIEKILNFHKKKQSFHTILLDRNIVKWNLIFIAGLVFSFFAGHLQTSFYLVLFSLVYLAWRLSQVKNNRFRLTSLFIILYSLFIIVTAVQWLPTLQFIKLSARGIDLNWQKAGWFLPWQHLVQFLVPDFFGNPTTLNYWGEWNYGEFVGYVGIIPLILAFYATFWRRDKKTFFFFLLGLVVLSFALPTPWARLPYKLEMPLVSTSQPTRLLFLVDFCLAILAALGLDYLLSCYYVLKHDNRQSSKRRFLGTLLFFGLLYGGLWVFVLLTPRIWPEISWITNLAVSKRNLILPSGVFIAFVGLFFGVWLLSRCGLKKKFIVHHSSLIILMLIIFDLLRFGWKFTPFTKREWLFPSTKTIEFLQKDKDIFRLMAIDRRILPPNFASVYKFQDVAGYDPLYLLRYGELIAAMERNQPDISPPFGFNRIITPANWGSPLVNLLNVKYILSLTKLVSDNLELVFQEGETRVYENKNVFPRAFMVYDYRLAQNKQEAIDLLMNDEIDLARTVILEEEPGHLRGESSLNPERLGSGEINNMVSIVNYSPNQIELRVQTEASGILVLTDSNYPGWRAEVDGKETEIYRVDYNFRAIIVPRGTHEVLFKYGY